MSGDVVDGLADGLNLLGLLIGNLAPTKRNLLIKSGSESEAFRVEGESATSHTMTAIQQKAGTGAAINIVSSNAEFSSAEISGKETGHGTLKISHVNPSAVRTADVNAAVLSLDCQGKAEGEGTKAQGIFMTKTTYDKFTDGEFVNTSTTLKSASAVFSADTDVGLEVHGVSTGVIIAGTRIEAVISPTEVTMTQKAKKTETLPFELGRPPGSWLSARNTEKAILFRTKNTGVTETREVETEPTGVEGECFVLFAKEKKLFAKFGVGLAKEITIP